jgi:hypothetical protein
MKTNRFMSAAVVVMVCGAAPAFAGTQATSTPATASQPTTQTTTSSGTQAPVTTATPSSPGQSGTSPSDQPAGQPAGTVQPGGQGSTLTTTASNGITPAASVDHSTALALLDHVQKVLDKAVDGKGSTVSIERGLLDEVRAEVSQVKVSLQGEKR